MSTRHNIKAGLMTSLASITTGNGYDITVKEITDKSESLTDLKHYSTPLITVLFLGDETQLVNDGNNYLYSWDITLAGVVNGRNESDLHENISKLISSLKKYIHDTTPTGVHTNLTGIQFLTSRLSFLNTTNQVAGSDVDVRLIYYVSGGDF